MSSKIIVDLSTKHPNTYMHIYTGMCINTSVNIYRHAHKVEQCSYYFWIFFYSNVTWSSLGSDKRPSHKNTSFHSIDQKTGTQRIKGPRQDKVTSFSSSRNGSLSL